MDWETSQVLLSKMLAFQALTQGHRMPVGAVRKECYKQGLYPPRWELFMSPFKVKLCESLGNDQERVYPYVLWTKQGIGQYFVTGRVLVFRS